MKMLLVIALAMIAFSASARTIRVQNSSYYTLDIDFKDLSDESVHIQQPLLFQNNFRAVVNGPVELKISLGSYVYCEGFDYNSVGSLLIIANADGSCTILPNEF